MNLYRIGHTVLNLDRVNGILDPPAATEAGGPAGPNVLRVLFDDGHIDLADQEAKTFRQWYRHVARSLDPRKDETGEALIAPADQVRRGMEIVLELIDQGRPRNVAARRAAHRLSELLDRYLTGELQPARAREFESQIALRQHEADG